MTNSTTNDSGTAINHQGGEAVIERPVVSTCADHTYGPGDYVGWHEWAAEKTKTHTQTKCPECGLFLIWEENRGV